MGSFPGRPRGPRPALLALVALLATGALAGSGVAVAASASGGPSVTITSAPPPFTPSQVARIRWKFSGNVAGHTCRLDGARFRACAPQPVVYSDLSEGRHVFTIHGDFASGASDSASVAWIVDTHAPSAPSVGGGSTAWRSVASASVTAAGAHDAGSGVAGYESETSTDHGLTWSDPADGRTVTVAAAGETLVRFRAVDGAGNRSAWAPESPTAGSTVRLDRDPPAEPLVTGGSDAWQNAVPVSIRASGSTDSQAGLARYEFRTSHDALGWGAPHAGDTADVGDEGVTYVQFRAVDAAGNRSAWVPDLPTSANTAKVDMRPPPTPSAAGGSFAWQAVAGITIGARGVTDAGSGDAAVEYRTSTDQGGTWSAPHPGAEASITQEGETLVQFRVTDGAGNHSAWGPDGPTPGSTARIDRGAPEPPTVSVPAGWQNGTSALAHAGGATDALAGVVAYEYRASTDGGQHWSDAASGADLPSSAEGETAVQFRAVDAAGNRSAWAPQAVSEENTIRIDRTAPSAPVVGGGSTDWQAVDSVTVEAAGALDDRSGLAGYEYRTSRDAGATWSAASPGDAALVAAEGETLVQFRSRDAAGNASAWVPATGSPAGTARIDRGPPSAPMLAGGSFEWQSAASLTVSASGAADPSGIDHYDVRTSTDGGRTWLLRGRGASITIADEGQTLVQFRAVDPAGNASAWAPDTSSAASTVRLDRGVPSTPTVSGGSLVWQRADGLTISADGATDALAGVARYEHRVSRDGGRTWGGSEAGDHLLVQDEGETLVEFRSVDRAGNSSSWEPATPAGRATARLDRSAPAIASFTGGSAAWRRAASAVVSAGVVSDALSGQPSVEHRTSSDGGVTWTAPAAGDTVTVADEGETLVQFRATDAVGNATDWQPAAGTPATTVRLDRTDPTIPTVSGGDASWQNTGSVLLVAGGSTDSPGSGVVRYERRSSRDGGQTWTAATSGASLAVTDEGETLVQFRAVDAAGYPSPWAPAPGTPAAVVRIDRTAPSGPVASGGSLAWQPANAVTVTGAGAVDLGGSFVARYEHRLSTDGGSTWSEPSADPTSTASDHVTITDEGQTLVQFRSVDAAGNVSTWVPAVAGAANTVRIDRTNPTAPSAAGAPAGWTNAATVNVQPAGATDSPGSGIAGYEYQTRLNGGSWTASVSGSIAAVTAAGVTDVRFRAVDAAGYWSAWGDPSTVRVDRSVPSAPALGGGSSAWQDVPSLTVSVTAQATDAGGAGLAAPAYEYRTSRDAGKTWSASAPAPGDAVTVSAEGQTIVQMRSVDAAGNTSAWVPTAAAAGNTVMIDRAPPSDPTVTGGASAWQKVTSVKVSGGGSTDTGSGVKGYEYRSSTNGGTTWSAATSGTSASVTAEGRTIVQFRALDNAGRYSAWAPAAPTADSSANLDRTAPTAPVLSGASSIWQTAPSVTVRADRSSDALSGLDHYEYRWSTDGKSWGAVASAPDATFTGEGMWYVQFRSVDATGNVSAWTPTTNGPSNTVMIDRTPPSEPLVAGGSTAWQSKSSVTLTASGSSDGLGSGKITYQYRVSHDGGQNYSQPQNGASASIAFEGASVVQFRALDAAGLSSAWAPADPTPASTVMIDHTAPVAPAVAGGSLAWQGADQVVVSASGASDGLSGLAGLSSRTSTDGGRTWSPASAGASVTVTGEGQTLVQFQATDTAGNPTAWTPAAPSAGSTVKLDRTPPTDPSACTGGSAAWQSKASLTLTASGAADTPGSGIVSSQWRTWHPGAAGQPPVTGPASTGAATVSAEGESFIQFRAVDAAGGTSGWGPVDPSSVPGCTVRLDRSAPPPPAVSGGSTTWRNVTAVAVSPSAVVDAVSGLAGYQFRTSPDNGATWTQPATATGSPAQATVTAEGQTLVQYRSLDGAGNASAWAPATAAPENTVRIDRSAPSAPAASGGSLAWQSVPSLTLSAAGATDSASGVAGYEYRTSTNGGVSWSAAASGASVTVAGEGETDVQFRAVDGIGLTSAWAPAAGTAGATVHIDRTAPGVPVVSGDSALWRSVAAVTVTAGASVDTLPGAGSVGYEYRLSTDGGSTWGAPTAGASAAVAGEGETRVQFRSFDAAAPRNSSAWAPTGGARVRLDRTAPSLPAVVGGSEAWQDVPTVTVSAVGSIDGASGFDHYEVRSSRDGGTTWSTPVVAASLAVSDEGETDVQFRAVDALGNASDWTPAAGSPAGLVRIDRTRPTAPAVSGGSDAWTAATSVDVSAGGSADVNGSGVAGYQYRLSSDSGLTWGNPTAGATATVGDEGETIVQFRALDGLGHVSAWAPSTRGPGSTVRLDRTAPDAPASVAGGGDAWVSRPSVTVAASGGRDTLGEVRYEFRTSADGGASWSAPGAGAAAAVTAEGRTVVQFRSVDQAGNRSPWVPDAPTPTSTVMLDRTAPSDPAVSGGSLAWQASASVEIDAGGSSDALAGLAAYQHRTSLDGGRSWSEPAAGATVTAADEGQTLVQFRALDGAGNASAWYPDASVATSTARLDRTAPGEPTVTGGSLSWTSADSVPVLAGGATDANAGIARYEYEISHDGGSTWSDGTGALALVADEGETVVRFRAVDAAGNASAWAPAAPTAGSTVRIDRAAPTPPDVSGGSDIWQHADAVAIAATGGSDARTGDALRYESRASFDGGQTWTQALAGATRTVTREGATLVQFRTLDAAGNPSAWAPADPAPASTVMLDRSPPTAPTLTGGSDAWRNSASETVSAQGSLDPLAGFDHYEMRVSRDRGQTWSVPASAASVTVSDEGETLVQFRAVDRLGAASPWTPASSTAESTVRLDRTAPSVPTVSGGASGWQDVDAVTLSASGSTDPGSGVAGPVSYQYRTSSDGTSWSDPQAGAAARVTAEGTTYAQFRAIDAAGNTSAGWVPDQPVPASTARIDRTAPSLPSIAGGSGAWQDVGSITVTASGSIDGASGLDRYEHRLSSDGGQTWSGPAAGASVTVTQEGQTLVQFRAVDASGLPAAWTPTMQTAAATVRIDRTAPSAPTLAGGSLAWQDIAAATVSADGATDGLAGAVHYSYRTSLDGGQTWSAPADGGAATATREGETLVQFEATDAAGNASGWVPVQPVAASTIRIDRTAPSDPVASGGSLTWSSAASATVTGSSSDAGSGVASLEHRVSVDGGTTWSAPSPGASVAVIAQGETLVEFRATDVAGKRSAWAPRPRAAGATVRLDRSSPSAPTVTGGSAVWRNTSGVTLSASGSTDAGGSGLGAYRWRTSSDGAHWSEPHAGVATINAEGTTYVQFQASDTAGNASPWAPAAGTAAATVKLDRSAPTLPAVTGGSATCAARRTISASGATDAGAGSVHYESRVSTDGGASYGAAKAGASLTLSASGHYVVQFRAIDALGNASAWAPANAGAANSACIG